MRERLLSEVAQVDPQEVAGYVWEAESDHELIRSIRSAYRRWTRYFPLPTDFMVDPTSGSTMFFHAVSLYALVRLVRPNVVVETGGTPGKSSAFILRALQRNQEGHLYTIDLPPPERENAVSAPGSSHTARPPGSPSNWAVPEWLRARQTLILAPSQQVLPTLLPELGGVSLFCHDSDHSYAHMRWELETAYRFLEPEGYIWCDDILANAAWTDFCRSHPSLAHWEFTSQGIARRWPCRAES